MKVRQTGRAGGATPSRRAGRAGAAAGSHFADAVRETEAAAAASGAGAATETSAVAGLDALVALQGVGDADDDRRRGAARAGHDILDQLERLRLSLLAGQLNAGQLERLAEIVRRQRARAGDPALDAVLDEIEMRAAVELAKLERGRG